MSLHRRIVLLLLWVTPPASAALATWRGGDWELTAMAGVLMACGATAAQPWRHRRDVADLAVAVAVTLWAALAMGCLLADGASSAFVVLPPLVALGLAFRIVPPVSFALVGTGIACLSGLPWLAGTATPEAGLRSVIVVAALVVLVTLRPRAMIEITRRRMRMSTLRRGAADRTSPPGLLIQAERRADGGLVLGLALASVPPAGMRIRVLPH